MTDVDAPDSDLDDDDDDAGNRALAPVATAVLRHLATSLVDDTDSVRVEALAGRGRRIRLAVTVAPDDFGRLIGRRGRVAAAVRTVVAAASVQDGAEVEVEFVE